DVCLTDGSQFKYGTFDESCTDNICDTLTIDTNGKKGPNTAGKDRFTINLTPNGVKALGESDSCENGLDCGAYILAHHKLWTGEVEIAQTPVIPEGCADAQCSACTDNRNKPSDGACIPKTNAELFSDCKSNGTSTCNFTDGIIAYDIGDKYVADLGNFFSFDDAKEECTKRGMELPDVATLTEIYDSQSDYPDVIKNGTFYWSSTLLPSGNGANCVKMESGYVSSNDNFQYDNLVVCVSKKTQ
ncbi:hypothetical protein IJ732_00775, partial [bacterium]|nr:hypothetical protein [bacterium]